MTSRMEVSRPTENLLLQSTSNLQPLLMRFGIEMLICLLNVANLLSEMECTETSVIHFRLPLCKVFNALEKLPGQSSTG